MIWRIVKADAIDFLRSQPADSIDLVFGSPPYEQARLYLEGGVNLGVSRKTDAWVAWMVEVYKAAAVACKGLVAFVVAGQTRGFKWSAGPALLAADLHRAGLCLRNPPIFHRVGIPGSGGPDWLRSDYEWIICTSRPGKLPWSDNTAAGHPPKWAPGGEMSHRVSDGPRVNQWWHPIESGATGTLREDGFVRGGGKRPSHVVVNGRDQWGGTPHESSGEGRQTDGEHKGKKQFAKINGGKVDRTRLNTEPDGSQRTQGYSVPVMANPGNVIKLNVGGGLMGGDQYSSQNEAPFPEKLADFFIRSFCPPGGTVCDPFSGSGTTAAVSVRNGRNFVGCDLRQSQVDLGRNRVEAETPQGLFKE